MLHASAIAPADKQYHYRATHNHDTTFFCFSAVDICYDDAAAVFTRGTRKSKHKKLPETAAVENYGTEDSCSFGPLPKSIPKTGLFAGGSGMGEK